MANKVFFEKETEKPIDEQFVKHVPFAVTTRMLRSAANNGGLRDGEFYDDFFMHIGTSSSNTRFYNALRYIASHGYKPTKDFKKLFDKGYYGKDWETAKKFTFDQTNLAMFEETIYDLVAVINMRDFVARAGFDKLDPQTLQNIQNNLDILEQNVVSGESIHSQLLANKRQQEDVHTQIDRLAIKEYGVDFRQSQPTTVLWESLGEHTSKDPRREFILNYAANGTNVSLTDSDEWVSMRCMDSMLGDMVQSSTAHKSKMCINSAIRYSNKTEFEPYHEPQDLADIY